MPTKTKTEKEENILVALRELIKEPNLKIIIEKIIAFLGKENPEVRKSQRNLLLMQWSFGFAITIAVLITIFLLATNKLISGDVTAGLLGLVIGYLFGARKTGN